jgi:hypothetical protein
MPTPTSSRLNSIFRLGHLQDGIAAEVTVDDDGHIQLGELLGDQQLTQAEAVDLAEKLLTAVQASIHRDQIVRPDFFSAKEILQREESRLGQAIRAARRVYHL